MANKSEEQRRDEASSHDVHVELATIREESHQDYDAINVLHRKAVTALEFVNANQWDSRAEEDRRRDRRPMLTFSKLAQFIDRNVGAHAQRRTSVKVRAEDKPAEKAIMNTRSRKRMKGAEAREGMIRYIEFASQAQIAYLNAFEHQITCGFGHIRMLADYVDGSFSREPRFVPVIDPFSVIWDQASLQLNKSDARRCMVTSLVPIDDFKREFPGAAISDWDQAAEGLQYVSDWQRDDNIVVAERYTKVNKTVRLVELSDDRLVEWEDDEEKIRDELAKMGVTVRRHRQAESHDVYWSLVTGMDILEGPIKIEGKEIPVVTAYGRPVWTRRGVHYRSMIEHALDEQRAYNYARNAILEAISAIPKAPWLVGYSQVKGFENVWRTANERSHAYLPWNDEENPNPPQRQFTSQDISGFAALAQMAEAGMNSAMGQYESSLGIQTNETSGRAVLARKDQADQVVEPYVENHEVALTQLGNVLLSALPEILEPGQTAKILNEDESDDAVELAAERVQDEETGDIVAVNDLAAGRYSCVVTTGPSFDTRRQEALQGMVEFGATFPAMANILGPEAMANTDFPGSERIARMGRALLPPEILEAGEDSEQELPPHVMAAMRQAQETMQQAETLAQQAAKEVEDHKKSIAELELRNAAVKAKSADDLRDAKFDYDKRLFELEKRMVKVETPAMSPNSRPRAIGE